MSRLLTMSTETNHTQALGDAPTDGSGPNLFLFG